MMRALLALALLASPLAAQQTIDRRWPADPDVTLRITNLPGRTRIIGWARDTIAVSGSVPVGAGEFYGGGGPRAAKLGIEGSETADGASTIVLEVRVPTRARVWLKSTTGSVDVTGLTGEVDLTSVSGNLRVEGAPRRVSAESIDGNIEIVGAVPLVQVKTGNGIVIVRGSRGELSVTSVSGAIRIGGASVERGRLESVDGEISFKGIIAAAGALDVETHGGAVELRVPPTLDADYTVTTLGGKVTNELAPAAGTAAKAKPLYFSTGHGGAAITVRSFKGPVTLLSQPRALEAP